MATMAYIPNDPLAVGGPPMRQVRARTQPRGSAGFDLQPSVPAGIYAPDTFEFGHWQANEALIRGLRTWRALTGEYPPAWFGDQQVLPVLTDAGDDLNAFYDRASLQFFHHRFDGTVTHSAESVDVVVHEEGHALLDMIRPDFFDVPFLEVAALHEAFGDCMALLTALEDRTIREAVVGVAPDLDRTQFVESLAEELGDAIRREFGPGSVEAGALRHALNRFAWSDPTRLPPNGPADTISAEAHSFSRVFSGAFYDSLRAIYASGPRTALALGRAARTAGRLLIAAIRTVPAAPRIFDGVGRRMLSSDVALNGGINVTAIRGAFEAHGLPLPAPVMSMPVPLPGARTRGAASTQLREQLGVPAGTRLTYTETTSVVDGDIAHVVAYRSVEVSEGSLAGVYLRVPAVARVRTRGRSVVGVLGDVLPAEGEVETEGRAFARALVANGDILGADGGAFAEAPRRRLRGPARIAGALPPRQAGSPYPPTHRIAQVDGQPTLVRIGFA